MKEWWNKNKSKVWAVIAAVCASAVAVKRVAPENTLAHKVADQVLGACEKLPQPPPGR